MLAASQWFKANRPFDFLLLLSHFGPYFVMAPKGDHLVPGPLGKGLLLGLSGTVERAADSCQASIAETCRPTV